MARKLKKILKKAAPLLAIAGLGKAFMNARNLRKQNNEFLATEGGDRSDMSNLINEFGVKTPRKRMPINPASFLIGVGDDPGGAMIDGYPVQAGAKDGGRIVKTEKGGKAVRRKKKIGIQIKGFGKARRT